MSFLMTQSLSTFKNLFKKINELRKVNFQTEHSKKRNVVVNNANSKLFDKNMRELDDEYDELLDLENKINNTFVGNAEDIDTAMSIYALLEYR